MAGIELVVVLVGAVSDVLVIVLVEDVVGRLTSPRLVVVVALNGGGPTLVVLDVLVVVVTVGHRTRGGVGRQRSTTLVGVAPGSTATRARRVRRTGTVKVSG
jgi:hypothetical protein